PRRPRRRSRPPQAWPRGYSPRNYTPGATLGCRAWEGVPTVHSDAVANPDNVRVAGSGPGRGVCRMLRCRGGAYRRAMRILRLAGLATTLVAAGFLAAGCDLTVNYLNDGFSTDDRVTEVRLERGGSGDVEIRGDAAVTGIDVRRKVRYASASAPAETAVVEGTRLTLDFDCGHNCSVSYVVRLPKGAAVSGATNSGDIMLAEVDTVDVKAGSGDIELTDVTGPATVSANSGNI